MASVVQTNDEYHGSLLEILTIVLVSISFLVVSVRGVARYRISRLVESVDILLPLALVSPFSLSAHYLPGESVADSVPRLSLSCKLLVYE